jgi:RNA polymerase sigma-70 factor (ECF subfamily)
MDRTNGQERWLVTEARLRDLMVRGQNGDETSYLMFLKEVTAYLRGYFRRHLARRLSDTEDLLQETLLALHNHRHTYDVDQPVTPWVRAIAQHKLVDLLRSSGTRDLLTESWDEDMDVLAASDNEALEAHLDVTALLARLPDRYRLPVQLVKLEGLSVSAAARATGMSESAIKVGIHRGLKLLAKKVSGDR